LKSLGALGSFVNNLTGRPFPKEGLLEREGEEIWELEEEISKMTSAILVHPFSDDDLIAVVEAAIGPPEKKGD
jgi:hypothetical protein